MIRIALLGAPGTGKSTLAAYTYAKLKDKGLEGDQVTEYIREHINRLKKIPSITFQSIIYERQLEKERILPDNLDFMVTDSPTLLSYIYGALYIDYNDQDHIELLSDLYYKFLKNSRNSYDLVYVLDHNHAPNMNDGVRYQTKEEMTTLKNTISSFLDLHRIEYKRLGSDLSSEARADIIVADVLKIKNRVDDLEKTLDID